MTIVGYYRDFYHERINKRVAVLACLKSINDRRISEREVWEKEQGGKRRKLNVCSSNSSIGLSSSGSGGSIVISAEMMEGLPPGVLTMINTMRAQIEEKDHKIEENGLNIETLTRMNDGLRKDFRILNGVLAESKIAAFEMWREILMFL